MSKVVNVAVAVIHFNNQYLLGYRNAHQHQGEKYEFIGGKIEVEETPKQGLIREVMEEIGCDISANTAIKMGVIRHDYSDKSVALHCYKIEVCKNQFDQLQTKTGQEGQVITWINKADLLAEQYPLPDANARILDWLNLPDTIFISQSLDNFATIEDWVSFYAQKLPPNATFYIRPQANIEQSINLINNLLNQRADVFPIIQYETFLALNLAIEERGDRITQQSHQNFIVHLNHYQLIRLDFTVLPRDFYYFASCHDKNSLSKLNNLAKTHTVTGGFLSPVLPTPTHPNSEILGWEKFSTLALQADFPLFALGGVGQADLAAAYEHGAMGIAGIRLLVDKV